jgi:uncharacterized protein YkwD
MSYKIGGLRLLSAAVLAGTLSLSIGASALAAPITHADSAVTLTAARIGTAHAAAAKKATAPVKFAAAPLTDQNGYAWISYFRGLAGLKPVTRSASLESQDALHVRYLANHALPCETDVHDELTTRVSGCGPNPAATAAGKAAANNSVVTRVRVNASAQSAVSDWFGSAFHALTLLDPRLQATGYAGYYTATPAGSKPVAWPFTAAANVYQGRTGRYNGAVVAFPANNSSTPLLSYQLGTESPEPFRQANTNVCPGWSTKSTVSSPVIVQWPMATGVSKGQAVITDLTTHTNQPTCGLTGSSYPSGSVAREFLNGANGITDSGFYYSANPFTPGHRYQLRIGGGIITTFTATSLSTS